MSTAQRVALGFVIFGFGWIFVSDAVVFSLLSTETAIRTVQLWKGFLFVMLSALLIWWMVSRRERRESEQLNGERRLRQQYRSTLDSLEEAVFVVRDRVISDCNAAAERMFGWPCEELIGMSTERLHVDSAHFEEFARVGEPVLRAGRPFEFETTMRRRDGSTFPTEHTVTLIDESAGLEGGAVSVVRDVTVRREAEQQRERFYEHLHEVREMERRRIAREIHDELGQALTGMKIDLSRMRARADSERIQSELSELDDLLEQTVGSVRSIAAELHPGVLDELGLVAALEWLARQHDPRFPAGCGFRSDVDDLDLPDSVASHAFRIVQEALTNALKHSGAERVTIRVEAGGEDTSHRIEVEDDGEWLDASGTGLGLIGMQERARMIGGRVRISREGSATCVKLDVPAGALAAVAS